MTKSQHKHRAKRLRQRQPVAPEEAMVPLGAVNDIHDDVVEAYTFAEGVRLAIEGMSLLYGTKGVSGPLALHGELCVKLRDLRSRTRAVTEMAGNVPAVRL